MRYFVLPVNRNRGRTFQRKHESVYQDVYEFAVLFRRVRSPLAEPDVRNDIPFAETADSPELICLVNTH